MGQSTTKATVDRRTASEWVIKSKEFFWLAFGVILASSILQLILFISGVTYINGFQIADLGNQSAWEQTRVWLRLILTSAGSILATLGLLMINRGNKNFFYFSLTATVLLTVNALVSNLFFDAIKWLSVGVILLTQSILWAKNLDNMKSMRISEEPMNRWFIIGAAVFFIAVISFLVGYYGIANIPSDSVFYNKKPVLDPMQFAFTIAGNIMMIFLIVESRIIYMIGNAITIAMFSIIVFSEHDWLSMTQLIQGILYLVITVAGYVEIKKKHIQDNEVKGVNS